ncbi:MAG: DUF1080 domain-containing protein [Verrucomicrobiales bacterium]|jgi:hypothetical protein|nr:DUF1080 domain-containing protein [Verrucomicrobiales bacterium]
MRHITQFFGALSCGLLLAGAELRADHHEEGFQDLFNGKDLSGWAGHPSLWSVQDGVIRGQTKPEDPIKHNTFLVWKNGTVDDFELRFSYKIVTNGEKGSANSGCQYRSKVADHDKFIVGGYQADFEAGTTYSGILYEERGRGILAQRGQVTLVKADPKDPKKTKVEVIGSVGKTEEIQAGIKANDWNDYIIIAKGNRLMHIINGRVSADVTDEQATHAAKSGVLAFQLHAGPAMTVELKNVRLRPLH